MQTIKTETVHTVQISEHELELVRTALRITERYYLRTLPEEPDASTQDKPRPDLARMYRDLAVEF